MQCAVGAVQFRMVIHGKVQCTLTVISVQGVNDWSIIGNGSSLCTLGIGACTVTFDPRKPLFDTQGIAL